MTPQTVETRWGPVDAVYGECDCGRYGWKRGEGENHVIDCASRTVVAYRRTRYVRCPQCDGVPPERPSRMPTPGMATSTKPPPADRITWENACPTCADSPLPGWVPEPCEACEGFGIAGGDVDESIHKCEHCRGRKHVTETMTHERYREIDTARARFANVESSDTYRDFTDAERIEAIDAWAKVTPDQKRFALAIHEAGF